MPPRDSLASYQWPDQLALEPDLATEQLIRETTAMLAKMEHNLPAAWVGRQTAGLAFEKFSDIVRYNRVQGLSVGAGYRLASRGFSSVIGSARFGISDRRPTGGLMFRRDAPAGRLDISAWRAVREMEPWTRGSSLGNSLNAALAGHDDAAYYLALGAGIAYWGNVGLARDAELELRFERARSMATRARSAVNDFLGGTGVLPPNPAILAGDFFAGSASRRVLAGPLDLRYGVEGLAGIGGGASGTVAGRGWTSARIKFDLGRRGGALTLRGGTSVGDNVPQLRFRVGGPETVRGYDYGTRSGRSMWSAQLDLALTRSGVLAPVVFADAGNISTSGKPLTSAGAGISLLGGLIRFNIAKGLSPKADVRFDLLFRTAR